MSDFALIVLILRTLKELPCAQGITDQELPVVDSTAKLGKVKTV
jgi:hypothetical protein